MIYSKRLLFVFFVFGFLDTATSQAQTLKPVAEHVIVIGLDAFSSRGLQKAATAAINKMIAEGALAPYARCVLPS